MVTYMLQKKNLSDIIRLLSGFLLSLKLLFNSFGVNFITYNQIDAIVNMDRTKKGTFHTGSFFIIAVQQLHLFAADHMILRYIEMYM